MHLILQVFSINEAQCLMRLILTVQQSLLDLRSNLTAISSTASKGQDDLKTTIQEALTTILQSENDFVNSAMEVRLPCILYLKFPESLQRGLPSRQQLSY